MKTVSDEPTLNFPVLAKSAMDKWTYLKSMVTGIIDRCVVVNEIQQVQNKSDPEPSCSESTLDTNPHGSRIEAEHCYETPCRVHLSQIQLNIITSLLNRQRRSEGYHHG